MDRPLKSPGLHALEEAFHRQFELSRSEPAPTLQARLDRLRRLRAALTPGGYSNMIETVRGSGYRLARSPSH